MDSPKVLIRKFRRGDEKAVKKIIAKETLVTVNPFFLCSVVREGVIQFTLMLSAVLFIAVGTSLKQSLCAIPAVVISLYIGIYIGHWVKIIRGHTDLDDVEGNYFDHPKKGFWVAIFMNPSKNHSRDYVFYGEEDFSEDVLKGTLNPTTDTLIGTVALDIKDDPDKKEPPQSVAFMRRLAVSNAHQRRGVGTALIRTALDHCIDQKFRAIELLTTEHHVAARSLYGNHGFALMNSTEKTYILWGIISISMHRLRVACSTVAKLRENPQRDIPDDQINEVN